MPGRQGEMWGWTLEHDASGNTTSDGAFAYTWDAESQMKTAAGITYTYDGDGRRVMKSNGKIYWYGSGGEILAETDAAGNTLNEYIFFGGQRIAALPASASPLFYVEDFLGSSRVITSNTGVVCYDADFDPFGGEHAFTNTCPQSYKFEGKERDAETGLDYAFARYYNPRLGRFMSTDPLGGSIGDPQTKNLYSYVANRPLAFVDPSGMCAQVRDTDGTFHCYNTWPQCTTGGGWLGWDEFELLEIATIPTISTVFAGWMIVGIENGTDTVLGGCGSGPGCFNIEEPLWDTVYSYPNAGLLYLASGPEGSGGGDTRSPNPSIQHLIDQSCKQYYMCLSKGMQGATAGPALAEILKNGIKGTSIWDILNAANDGLKDLCIDCLKENPLAP